MWISKKKLNELYKRMESILSQNGILRAHILNRIETLENNTKELIKAHNQFEEEEKYLSNFSYAPRTRKVMKYNHTIDTDTIKDITLEELARYVIDNKPIVREETIKVKTEYR